MSETPEVLAVHGQSIVVRMPDRRFPGVWLPADTLSTWLDALEEAESAGSTGAVSELVEELRAVLAAYSHDLLGRGEDLPYIWPRGST